MATDQFHEYLADRIDVTVSGTDFHVRGSYKTVEEFHDNIYSRISAAVKLETMQIDVRRVIGGGDSAVGGLGHCSTLSFLSLPFSCN